MSARDFSFPHPARCGCPYDLGYVICVPNNRWYHLLKARMNSNSGHFRFFFKVLQLLAVLGSISLIHRKWNSAVSLLALLLSLVELVTCVQNMSSSLLVHRTRSKVIAGWYPANTCLFLSDPDCSTYSKALCFPAFHAVVKVETVITVIPICKFLSPVIWIWRWDHLNLLLCVNYINTQ